jgi:hypothetical protein
MNDRGVADKDEICAQIDGRCAPRVVQMWPATPSRVGPRGRSANQSMRRRTLIGLILRLLHDLPEAHVEEIECTFGQKLAREQAHLAELDPVALRQETQAEYEARPAVLAYPGDDRAPNAGRLSSEPP